MLRAKFGALAEEIALPWFWARVHDRSIALGYIRGGFQLLYEALAARVRALGGEVCLGSEVRAVTPHDGRWLVTTSKGSLTAERVVSTLPPRLPCRLVPGPPPASRYRDPWRRAHSAHCPILARGRPLADGYWMNINDPGFPFMVLVEHTNFMPPEDYGGRHLVYLGNYRPPDDPLLSADKETVLQEFLPALARINPAFQPAWVTESWMFHAPYAQPIVTVDYREHIPPLTTPLPGLYQASMFQVYPHDRGQNYSVAMAERLARLLR